MSQTSSLSVMLLERTQVYSAKVVVTLCLHKISRMQQALIEKDDQIWDLERQLRSRDEELDLLKKNISLGVKIDCWSWSLVRRFIH